MVAGHEVHAQTTITLGTGTVTSYQIPVNLYYMNSICEAVYTASEISTAGWTSGAGLISSIKLQLNQANTYVPQAGSTFHIYLENTLDATLPSVPRPGATTGTLVWTGAHPSFNSSGWWNFTLSSAFCYSGGNLYVRIIRNDTNYGGTTPVWNNSSTASVMCRYDYWDTTPFNTNMIESYSRPNIQLSLTAGTPLVYSSCTTTQPNTNTAGAGFLNQEIIRMEVVTTGCGTPISVTSFSLNTTGTTNPANIVNAKVYYTGGSSVFAPVNQFGSTVVSPSGSFVVTGSRNLVSGVNYFWLAYDIAASAPNNNVVDAQCTSITVDGLARTPTVTNPVGSRTIMSPLNGVYTINPVGSGSTNFTSFTSAITTLKQLGVSGPVTFQVAAATYNERLWIDPIPGASAVNTVTFDGGTGNASTRIITGNPNVWDLAAIIKLRGADYLRFKNLTVQSTNANYGYGFYFTGGADYNEVDNCIINISQTTMSDSAPIVGSGDSTYYYYNGNSGSYNTIKNSQLNGGYYGIQWYGEFGPTSYSKGNQFINNTVNNFYYYGAYFYTSDSPQLLNNTFTARSNNQWSYGIMMYYIDNSPKIIGNKVTAGYSALYMYYTNQYAYTSGDRAKVINNFLVSNGTGVSQYTFESYYDMYMDVWFNSMHSITTSTSYIAYLYGSSGYGIDFRNNYMVYTGTGAGYLLYNNTSAMFTAMDYNAYYSSSSGTQFYYNGGTYANWASLPRTVHNINSKYGEPYFMSNTDLHSRSHAAYQGGQAIATVTTDVDGQGRNTPPCIGADEYPAPPPEFDMSVQAVRLDYATDKWAHREAPDQHQVKVVVENVGLKANPTQLTVVYKVGSAPTSAVDGVAQTFTPTWTNNKSTVTFSQTIFGLTPMPSYTVYARCFLTNEQNITNDTGMDTQTISGTKIHGYETFNSFVAPGFTHNAGYLDVPWGVTNANGGATWQVANAVGVGGSNAVQYPGDVFQANDWFFTPGAALIAGSSYRISFDMRTTTGQPQTVEVAFGDAPTVARMNTFATFSNFTNTTFMTAKQLAGGLDPYFNTPNVHQKYYVGFRVVSGANTGGVVIDNIKLDDNPSPPPKIGYALPGTPIANFINDPAIPITFVANYKSPGLIHKTYEVANTINIYGSAGDFLWDVESPTPWITITKATPDPTLQGYNFNPPRPRQHQTFTMSVDPAGLAPGVHYGEITMYAMLFNDDFPPPANGLTATNQPFKVNVELRITNAGGGSGPQSFVRTLGPLVAPNSYNFTDPTSGDPIATVQVTSGQIDQMTIRVFPNQLPQNLARMRYVKRYWQISHIGTAWTANVTFPYADHEAALVTDRNQLRGVRQAVALGAWEDPIIGTTSVSNPIANSVKVFDLNAMNIGGNIALAQPYGVFFKNEGELPTAFSLEKNYPNPFNPSTTVSFNVAEDRLVRLVVYNSLGMEVAELVNEILPAGHYTMTFDARDLPSGNYLCRMTAGEFSQTIQMVLSK